MIGVFDSGLGGVHTAQYIRELLPEYDYFVLADNKFLPYGEKDPEWIHDRVFDCLHRMFDQGCGMVILACNTASAQSIHHRQAVFPNKKVLSVSVPGVEAIIEGDFHHVCVFATQSTVDSNIYPMLFERYFIDYPLIIEQIPVPELVGLIEGLAPREEIYEYIKKFSRDITPDCEALILGCTHYPIVTDIFTELVGERISLIDPGLESARKIENYLLRHPEIEEQLSRGGTYKFIETMQHDI